MWVILYCFPIKHVVKSATEKELHSSSCHELWVQRTLTSRGLPNTRLNMTSHFTRRLHTTWSFTDKRSRKGQRLGSGFPGSHQRMNTFIIDARHRLVPHKLGLLPRTSETSRSSGEKKNNKKHLSTRSNCSKWVNAHLSVLQWLQLRGFWWISASDRAVNGAYECVDGKLVMHGMKKSHRTLDWTETGASRRK